MTDIVITSTAVVAGSNSSSEVGTAGETIAAGKPVYKNSTTKKWMLADTNSATAEARTAGGIALNGASLNQPVSVHKHGDLTIGATLTTGVAYYLSATAGGICPAADLTTGDYPCLVGMAKSASVLAVDIQSPGAVLA